VTSVLLLLGDGTQVQVNELPGRGPWTFVVLRPDPPVPATPDASLEVPAPQVSAAFDASLEVPDSGPSAASDPEPGGPAGGVAGFLTRFGRVVVPDLRGRPGWGKPPGSPGFLDLVDDLDQVRTRAGLGRPILVGLGDLTPVALRAAADQPWAWRALILAPLPARPAPAGLDQLDLPALVLDAGLVPAAAGSEEEAGAVAGAARLDDAWAHPGVVGAVERLLGRLGGGPGWAGVAPDAPPR
jgi:pimeloyl-ACP methyl ester carboxylesterase